MQNLLPVLIGAVALATALNVVLKRFNIPTVIGYIATGAIIGPLFGVDAHGNEQLEHIAEFGIVFLMFTIGLEFSVSHLLSMKRGVFLFGILSFSAGREAALRTAITLAQVGEFSLVVFSLLLANQMLDSVLVQIVMVTVVISMIDPGLKIIAKVPTEEDKEQLQTCSHELLIDGNSHTASLLVDNISRSRLLAAETSKLKFLADYSLDDAAAAIVKVELEQTRLFDSMSKSFDGLRQEADILQIKALLLSCTNHIDRLRTLFGSVGDNYRKLAGLAKGSAAA